MTDPGNSKPVLSIQDLSFTYGDGSQALFDVSLDIPPNEVYIIFGPARSGKTTLLRLFNRLSDLLEGASREGTILFNGRSIFMVFATPTPLPGSIYTNVTYGLRMAGMRAKDELEARLEKALRQAALWDEVKDRLDRSAFALSGGQKQRLCLARSLAMEPEVILLDNPTSGLDPISTSVVEQSLHELKKRYSIIMVPHSTQQAARIADRAAFMLDGRLIEVGEGAKLFVQPEDKRTEDYVTGRFG
jgi:phosphate transport system ATP-binding protein